MPEPQVLKSNFSIRPLNISEMRPLEPCLPAAMRLNLGCNKKLPDSVMGVLAKGCSEEALVRLVRRMLVAERKHRPKLDPNTNKPMSYTYNSNMKNLRGRLVKWMVDVANHFTVPRDTVCIALNYFDRYTCSVQCTDMAAQLVAFTAFFMACKFEEPVSVGLKHMIDSCKGFTISQVHKMEFTLLKNLNWNLRAGTLYDFLGSFMGLLDWSHRDKLCITVDTALLQEYAETELDLMHFDGASLRFEPAAQALASLVRSLRRAEFKGDLPVVNTVTQEVATLHDRDLRMVQSMSQLVGFSDFEAVDACDAYMARLCLAITEGASGRPLATPQKGVGNASTCGTPSGAEGIASIEASDGSGDNWGERVRRSTSTSTNAASSLGLEPGDEVRQKRSRRA